jgi:D-alanyl-D-alanine carboxypeptidase
MKKIRQQLYYAISAAVVGIVCAALLISLAKYVKEHFPHFSRTAYGVAENPALAKPLSPAQEQAQENMDEDAASGSPSLSATSAVSISKPHTVTASGYLVVDITDTDIPATATTSAIVTHFVLADRTILQKDMDRSVPIASLTKLVTAVVAQNILDQNAAIEITPHILATDGNTAGFRAGENFNVPELLYPLLMVSSNDAAEALAQSDPKGRPDFIRAMNEWTNSIGAYHTYFADPTGLSPNNVSSAGDLSIIMRWIAEHRPDLVSITDTKVKEFRIHTWTNPTQLLNLSSYLGGKNGYIPQSGETAVSLFQVGKKEFAVVVLGSSNRDQDILELMREATGVAYITYENSNTENGN